MQRVPRSKAKKLAQYIEVLVEKCNTTHWETVSGHTFPKNYSNEES